MDIPVKNPINDLNKDLEKNNENITKSVDKKTVIIVSVIILSVLVLVGIAYYLFIVKDTFSGTQDANASVFTPDDDEYDYYNEKYNFKMIVKKDWVLNEINSSIVFNAGDDARISFEAFEDDEFAEISEIDDRFCESFEQGFTEGLTGVNVVEEFNFNKYKQNGLDRCIAEGKIEDIRQKYNVFYNPELQLVYVLFYASINPEKELQLSEAMTTFRLAN